MKVRQAVQERLKHRMNLAERIPTQRPKDKDKLYALHAPEVSSSSKGKGSQLYKFGVKTNIAVTHKQGLIVGSRSFPGHPYDGHSLADQIEQTTNLLQDLDVNPTTVIVDLGYRGVDHLVPTEIIHRGRYRSLSTQQRRWLKGQDGDAHHTVLRAAGFILRWLLRAIARKGLGAFYFLLFYVAASAVMPSRSASKNTGCLHGVAMG